MKKNIINKKFETIFFTILLLVFILGFFAGWNFSDKSLSETELNFQQAQLDIRSIYERVEFNKIFEFESCDSQLINYLSNTLYKTGIELETLEKEKKIDTDYYNFLKQRHNQNQVLFYSEFKKYSQNCNISTNIILFFFDANNENKSKIQGQELDKISSNYQRIILPMDYNYPSNLEYFYKYYDIKQLPALIINFDTKLEGIQYVEEIESYLTNKIN